MTEFRTVTDDFSVAHQLDPADLKAAAEQGFKLVINNRPDGEDPAQTPNAEMQAAAEAAGLQFVFLPVVGRPTRDTAEAVHDAIEAADGKVLAYCRTGTRSINTWALGQALHGGDRRELLQRGAAAGYDLSAILS